MDKPPVTLHLNYKPAAPGKGRNILTRIYLEKDGKPLALCEQPAAVDKPKDGATFSLPFIMEYDRTGSKIMRLRTKEDDLIEHTRTRSSVPSARAIRMANAIMVERLLTTGKFGSATALAKRLGVSQPHLTTMLNMLNLPPEEIEQILFETR